METMINDIRAIVDYAQEMKTKYPERASEISTLSDIALLELEDGNSFTEEFKKLRISIEDLINSDKDD